MYRYIIIYIALILLTPLTSCVRHEAVRALDAVGDSASTVAVANLRALQKSLGSPLPGVIAEMPEIKAAFNVKGVDLERVAAVSYTPSLSAVIFSVTNPRLVKKSAGKVVWTQDGIAVYEITGRTYFVADSLWLWMVDSHSGPEGASEKVRRLREEASDSLAGWKKELLVFRRGEYVDKKEKDILGFTRRDGRYVSFNVGLGGDWMLMHAVCLNDSGEKRLWFEDDRWQRLTSENGRVDHDRAFTFAAGGFDGCEPVNISYKDFNLPLILKTFNDLCAPAGLNCNDGKGTSYAGCNLVLSVNAPAGSLADVGVDDSPPISLLAVARGSTFDCRIDFPGEKQPFLATLFRILQWKE